MEHCSLDPWTVALDTRYFDSKVPAPIFASGVQTSFRRVAAYRCILYKSLQLAQFPSQPLFFFPTLCTSFSDHISPLLDRTSL